MRIDAQYRVIHLMRAGKVGCMIMTATYVMGAGIDFLGGGHGVAARKRAAGQELSALLTS